MFFFLTHSHPLHIFSHHLHSGALHCHGLLWIEGCASTLEELATFNEAELASLAAWADCVSQESVMLQDDELVCPTAGCPGRVADFFDYSSTFARPTSVLPPCALEPKMVGCRRCEKMHAGSSLLWHSVREIFTRDKVEEMIAQQHQQSSSRNRNSSSRNSSNSSHIRCHLYSNHSSTLSKLWRKWMT